MISSVDERGTLYWKWENGRPKKDTPNDVGRAWVIEADGTDRDINGGAWITRAEAERLAGVGDYTLDDQA
jgi:hypothetical protein